MTVAYLAAIKVRSHLLSLFCKVQFLKRPVPEITWKVYVWISSEIKADKEDQNPTDEVLAAESLANYMRSNNSFVMDVFQVQKFIKNIGYKPNFRCILNSDGFKIQEYPLELYDRLERALKEFF